MTNIPHFDYPFRFGYTAHAVEVDQGTPQDVESCLITILLTEPGQRIELPEFGTESMLFDVQPVELDKIYAAVTDQEPRAMMVLAQRPDPLNYLNLLIDAQIQNAAPRIGGVS